MKKNLIIGGILSTALFLTGCGETLGKMMVKTGMTPDIKIVNKPDKVEKRLQSIAKNTIYKTKLKPISPKDVLVFNESSVPRYCVEAGWIIVKDMNGFNKQVKKKVGLFTQTVMVNNDIDAIKKKAAKLGIEAVNNHYDIGEFEILNQYIRPYETVQYAISPNQIRGNLFTYKKCSAAAENQCKKNLNNNKVSAKIRKINYYQCLTNCSIKEYKKPVSSKEVLYGIKAWVCAPEAIKKIRSGENTTAVAIEYKAAEIYAKIKKSLTQKKTKSIKNDKKKEIFKF